MELGWSHHLRLEVRSNEAHAKQEGSKQPFPPFHACIRAQAQALNHFTGPALPALPSLHYPPHPSFWNLFLSSHPQTSQLLSQPLDPSIHHRPFFDFEKQSVKMGYTKTDELAINTIRVLAVSQINLKPSIPYTAYTATASFAPPSPLPPPPPPLNSLFHRENLQQPNVNMINCAHYSSL